MARINQKGKDNLAYKEVKVSPVPFLVGAVVGLVIMVGIGVAMGQQEVVSLDTELILKVHEDGSITLKTLEGQEIKSFANIEALTGMNGLYQLIEQMELWD